MSYITNKDFFLEVAKGTVAKHSIVKKFGHNNAVGTTYVPLTSLGVYNTPQVASATTLRIKAGGDANDTAAGSGAREITLQGLDETGALVTETLATAGASASSATTTTFLRLFRAFVSASGTYATASAGSQAATITIENGAGGTDWATVELDVFPLAQTRIGAYSVPLGYTAYVYPQTISIESTKAVDIIFFQRQNILQTAAPYSAMRIVFEAGAITGTLEKASPHPYVFPALTDIGFMARITSGTADVDVDFDIILVQD